MTAPREVTAAFGILEEEGRVLLVSELRRLGSAMPDLCWDVPGGGIERGETLVSGLRREFREETGLDVEVGDLAFLIERGGAAVEDGVPRHGRFFFFNVRRAGGDLCPTDPEIREVAFKTWIEARSLCTREYQREFWAWFDAGRVQRYILSRPTLGA